MNTTETLILDLVEWIAMRDRTYEEVMAAWRTSCPRLPIWEDANDRGFVKTEILDGTSIVRATPAGREFLKQHRQTSAS